VETSGAQLTLAIDRHSDPISGSVRRAGGEPRRFSGWIDLIETIEEARTGAAEAETLGWIPGAKVARSA
jgi:hypothetical protein